MSLREKTILGALFGLIITGVLCAVGVFAFVTVQDAHPKRPGAWPELAVNFVGPAVDAPGSPVDLLEEWVSPADGRITSGFGGRWGTMHNGVDIANDVGTPVRAASAGLVIDSGPINGYGMWIRIAHPDDVVSIYGHIDETFVEVGQPVQAGDLIATVGDRGQSTGPHLHFQIEIAGRPVDPVLFYRDMAAQLTH